ncbi:MAG: hypothetical protein JO023_16900 [Chloroflexi bacterium]|nr:hypothetical protein [Chloroflexota bacterium]
MISTGDGAMTTTAHGGERRRLSSRWLRVGTLLLLWLGVGLAARMAQHAITTWT